MTITPDSVRPRSGNIDRVISVVRTLEGAGLGQLDWLGPNWIDALSDLNGACVEFLSNRVAQNTRLRRRILMCQDAVERRRLQMDAICTGLREYARLSGGPRA